MKHFIYLLCLLVLAACGAESENAKDTNQEEVQDKKQTVTQAVNPITEDSVLTEINNRVRDDINNIDLYLERANYHIEANNQKAAMADIDRAYRLDTLYIPTLLLQSDFLARNGKLDLSLRILQKADVIQPENSKVHTQFSKLYLIGRSNAKSLNYADLAIKYDLYNAEAYYLKGYNFLEMGDTAKAISSYRTSIEQDPEYFDAYLELGLIFSRKHDPISLDYYNNALEVRPNNRKVLYSKGMYEQEHELYNEAMATYTHAIKVHPDFKEAHYNLGYVHLFYLKLYRESRRYFTDAIEVDPRYYQAYYNRGYAFELLGDINNAGKDYRKALSINPTYDLAAQGLSRLKN